ncbi:MAG: curli assembly protein CsgF [Colwellia sp.]
MRNKLNRKIGFIAGCALFIMSCNQLLASELTYRPVNPSFGGNALNGSFLLNNANAQNDYKESSSSGSSYQRPTELERFTSSLQSRLVGQLLADVGNGNSGALSTDQFTLVVADDGSGGIEVVVTDKVTGDTTAIAVNGLIPD